MQFLQEQLDIHKNNLIYSLQTNDFSSFKLFDVEQERFVKPPDLFRKLNDILAATFCDLIPITAMTGYDAFDLYGNTYELKLCFISAKNYRLHPSSGRIWLDNKKDSFESGTYARYDVRPSTDIQLHNKHTLFVLISSDHGKFIDAFGMNGSDIVNAISTQNSLTRKVSLNKFLKFGYRFKSTVPHIGYENYLHMLKTYISNNISYQEFICQ